MWYPYNYDETGSYYGYFDDVVGDIADFSSYATPEKSPTGQRYPWITAPGHTIGAAVNHYSSEYTSNDGTDVMRLNKSLTYPYGEMSGTSMATPTAAGIVALWLQVAHENGLQLTNSDVKTIMAATAINDEYTTTGTYAARFGNGKIDALAGIQYILAMANKPMLTVDATTLSLAAKVEGSDTETFTVTGLHLTGGVTLTLNDANGVFSLNRTSLSAAEAEAGQAVTVTFAPSAAGTYTATVTLSSEGATDVTVTLNGTATELQGKATDHYLDVARYKTINDAGLTTTNTSFKNLYTFTPYDNNEAWLTVGAFAAVNIKANSNNHQNWYTSSTTSTSSSYYNSTSWSEASPFQASTAYYNTARAWGYSNTTLTVNISFYVTNCRAAKARMFSTSSQTTRTATLTVYECTENADGTLTASGTASGSETKSSFTEHVLKSMVLM